MRTSGSCRNNSTISGCYCTGSVTGNWWYTGGFNGYNAGSITDCFSNVSVSGANSRTGGFCSRNDNAGTIYKCYSNGSGSGTTNVGGFCGENYYGSISQCYSNASANGSSNIGGFCGINWEGSISECYSTGSPSGSSNVGGFCGFNNSTISDCFWDTQTSGKATSAGGTGKTTAEMYRQSTFDPPWDFISTWYMWSCDYPKFEPDPSPVTEVWVNGSYCDGCGNDGHIWNCDAYDNLDDAMAFFSGEGTINVSGDVTYSGDLTLVQDKQIVLLDGNLTITGNINNADENNYIATNGTGKLIHQMSSAVTYHIGTIGFYAPCTITAPVGNSFGVSVQSWGAFPSRCFWDIEHTAGSDLADVEFIYTKSGVPSHAGDMAAESYVYHFTGTEWEDLTPGGASTGDWAGNSSYYSTTATCVTEFSPFAPVGASGLIPTLTEWAAIIMGGLLLIFGGWFVWRRIT